MKIAFCWISKSPGPFHEYFCCCYVGASIFLFNVVFCFIFVIIIHEVFNCGLVPYINIISLNERQVTNVFRIRLKHSKLFLNHIIQLVKRFIWLLTNDIFKHYYLKWKIYIIFCYTFCHIYIFKMKYTIVVFLSFVKCKHFPRLSGEKGHFSKSNQIKNSWSISTKRLATY